MLPSCGMDVDIRETLCPSPALKVRSLSSELETGWGGLDRNCCQGLWHHNAPLAFQWPLRSWLLSSFSAFRGAGCFCLGVLHISSKLGFLLNSRALDRLLPAPPGKKFFFLTYYVSIAPPTGQKPPAGNNKHIQGVQLLSDWWLEAGRVQGRLRQVRPHRGRPGQAVATPTESVHSPLKKTILWSLVRSYTASTLSRCSGRPRQKRCI